MESNLQLWVDTLRDDLELGWRSIENLRSAALERQCLPTISDAATFVLEALARLEGPVPIIKQQSFDGHSFAKVKIGERFPTAEELTRARAALELRRKELQ